MDDRTLRLAEDIYARMMVDSDVAGGPRIMADEALRYAKIFYQVFQEED